MILFKIDYAFVVLKRQFSLFFFECCYFLNQIDCLLMKTLSITTLTIEKALHGDKDIYIQDNIKLHNAVSKYIIATKRFNIFYTLYKCHQHHQITTTSSRIVCFCNIFCIFWWCFNYNYSIHKTINLIKPKPDLNEYNYDDVYYIIFKTSYVSIDVAVFVILHSNINEILLTILTNHTEMVYISHYICSKCSKILSKNKH